MVGCTASKIGVVAVAFRSRRLLMNTGGSIFSARCGEATALEGRAFRLFAFAFCCARAELLL
jgi:hypothetical protein